MQSHLQTADRILDLAQSLAQTRGYNGFSYADIAEGLGIRKASIHYHFPKKSDLACALLVRYRTQSASLLARIDSEATDAALKLRRYVALEEEMLAECARICLCGMFASDVLTLPDSAREEINGFFKDTETWLAGVLQEGRAQGTFHFSTPADEEAQLIAAGLQGALLIARSRRDPDHLGRVAVRMLASLGVRS